MESVARSGVAFGMLHIVIAARFYGVLGLTAVFPKSPQLALRKTPMDYGYSLSPSTPKRYQRERATAPDRWK
jgi:hypothetical protein